MQINWQCIVEYMLNNIRNNIHINMESAYQNWGGGVRGVGGWGAVVKFEKSRKRDFLWPFN